MTPCVVSFLMSKLPVSEMLLNFTARLEALPHMLSLEIDRKSGQRIAACIHISIKVLWRRNWLLFSV